MKKETVPATISIPPGMPVPFSFFKYKKNLKNIKNQKKESVMKKVGLVLFLMVFAGLGSLYSLNIFDDDFDQSATTMAGWKLSSTTYITKYTGTYKQGLAAMQVRKNYNAVTYINVSPFKNMVLKFKMAAYSLEAGEYIRCQYNIAGTWVTAATLADGADNGTFKSYSVSIPTGTTLQIRFIMNGTATDDYGYVDDVILTGDRK